MLPASQTSTLLAGIPLSWHHIVRARRLSNFVVRCGSSVSPVGPQVAARLTRRPFHLDLRGRGIIRQHGDRVRHAQPHGRAGCPW